MALDRRSVVSLIHVGTDVLFGWKLRTRFVSLG